MNELAPPGSGTELERSAEGEAGGRPSVRVSDAESV